MNGYIQSIRTWLSPRKDLVIVLAAGAVGGALATTVQALLKLQGNLEFFVIPKTSLAHELLFALFGAIAAGVSVYLAANSKLDEYRRLAFFSLVCGITFPGILANSIDQAAEQAQQKLKSSQTIASQSPDAAATVAADAFRQLSATPQVDAGTKASIEGQTTALVKQLQGQGEPGIAAATEVVKSANDAGYAVEVAPPSAGE